MYSIYSKSLLFASISYLQESFKFSFDLQYYLILGGTNNVLHFSVTKIFVHSVESGTSEKVLQ